MRRTSISPGYVRTELADSIDDRRARDEIRKNMEIGDITIRLAIQG